MHPLQAHVDHAVAAVYGGSDLGLGPGSQETRHHVRFTMRERACQTLLDRLLALSHQRHAEEEAAAEPAHQAKPGRGRAKKAKPAVDNPTVF
jgi:hypothetical protein